MKRIVYLGSAFAGKGENLRALLRMTGGRLATSLPRGSAEGMILSLETKSAHGPVTLSTVPGFVFRDTARRELVAAADALVFVVDGRPERYYQTLEAWENIREHSEGRSLPIVIQYNFRDAPEATPIEVLEESLGIEPYLVAQNLRMPNPIGALYPHRLQAVASRGVGVRETFDAAAGGAYFGFPRPDVTAAQFAMTMLERKSDRRLSASSLAAAPGTDFLDDAASLAEATVLHEITCPTCDHVQPHFEIAFQEPGAEGPFRVGHELPVDLSRIDPELYLPIRPHDGGPLLFLDAQRCPKCETICWVGLVVEKRRLSSVWPVKLTRTTLERCHYATSGITFVAAGIVGLDVDDVLPHESLPILRKYLAP